MAEMKLDVGFMHASRRPQPPPPRVIQSMGHLVAVVKQRNLDPELEKNVIKIITGYPDGSLDYAYATLDRIIAKCQESSVLRKLAPEAPKPQDDIITYVPEDFEPKKEKLEQRKPIFDQEQNEL